MSVVAHTLSWSFARVSTPGQIQTGLGPRVYPFTTQAAKGYPPIPMLSKGLLIGKRPFQDGAMSERSCIVICNFTAARVILKNWFCKTKSNENAAISRQTKIFSVRLNLTIKSKANIF